MKRKILSYLFLFTVTIAILSLYCLPLDIDESAPGRTSIIDTAYILKTFLNPSAIHKYNVGNDKLVALTIDDGPDPRFTPQILDILQQYHIQATFFVVGRNIKQYPELLVREIKTGNEIENHTYTHPNLREEGLPRTRDEVIRNQQLIESYTHKRPLYFRPPKGLLRKETTYLVESNGYRVVLWTICAEHAASKTPKMMAERVVEAASPGTIVLVHDGRLDRSSTVKALPLLIEGYQKKGYRFVTLEEMLQKGNYLSLLAQR